MSGTSADGIDAVLVEFKGDPSKPKWKILNTGSYEYPSSIREKIIQVGQGLKINNKEWLELAEEITELNALAARTCDPDSTAEVVADSTAEEAPEEAAPEEEHEGHDH